MFLRDGVPSNVLQCIARIKLVTSLRNLFIVTELGNMVALYHTLITVRRCSRISKRAYGDTDNNESVDVGRKQN